MSATAPGGAWWRTTTTRRGAVAAGAILCLLLTGWFGVDMEQPLSFTGDHLLTLGNARTYIDGNGFRWNPAMGFPGQRDSLLHPTFYFSQKSIMWLATFVTSKPAKVVAIFYGVSVPLTFLAAYLVLRRLGIRRWTAWLGGLVFVASPYFAARAVGHDMLSAYYSVPPGAFLALRTGLSLNGYVRQRLRDALSDPVSWLLVLVVGTSGLYYAFFTAMFVMAVGCTVAVVRRWPVPFLKALVVCGGIVAVLLLTGPGFGLLDIVTGRVTLPMRLSMEQQLYGLAIRQWVVVFDVLPLTAAWWNSTASLREWPGVFLTLVIVSSPLLLVAALAARFRSRDPNEGARAGLVALCALCIVFGVIFCMRDGLGFYFNEYVTSAIRAQSRVMPFLTFFALVIVLHFHERLASKPQRRAGAAASLVVAGALVLSIPPQAVGVLAKRQQAFLANSTEQADRASIAGMLDVIHAAGLRRILELPVVYWPEAPIVGEFDPYRLELPHILDRRGSEVRWSYGLSNRQPTFGRVLAFIDGYRNDLLANAAVGLGYDAILIEKSAFAGPELEAWTVALTALPASCRVFDDAARVLYALREISGDGACVDVPAIPSIDTIRYVTAAGRHGRTTLYGGWSSAEEEYTWSDGPRAALGISAPQGTRFEVDFRFMVYRPDARLPKTIVFRTRGGQERRRIEIRPEEPAPSAVTVSFGPEDLEPNGTVFLEVLLPDAESPAAYGAADPRELGIALYEYTVRRVG